MKLSQIKSVNQVSSTTNPYSNNRSLDDTGYQSNAKTVLLLPVSVHNTIMVEPKTIVYRPIKCFKSLLIP